MLSVRKSMKLIACSLFVLTFLLVPVSSFGENYETPHGFSAGDVISADIMNEVFAYIENATCSITASDLVGTWSCNVYHSGWEMAHAVPGWTLSIDGLYGVLEDVTITFSDDGDGTYSLSTSAPNPFHHDYANSHSTKYEVAANTLFLNATTNSQAAYRLSKVSESRIVCWLLRAQNSDTTILFILDKSALPPANPTDLSATISNLTVTLSWTDNSDNETGFKVMRRDTLEGEYAEIATTAADTTNYDDTVSEAGDYWYRIKATNENGDSLGSNVVKVTLSE